eukprot:TRINITY_DN1454_c0_g1_i12.p1 TRINITY_DN1454_c0_g1~~TRINITY_DN1454_c0_g1_i12.p1  ORF type:complete len:249 (+),score=89.64 TRINITY_DN1454_c0_g1_i12:74-820(+)
MAVSGTVTSYNAHKGFGFIECNGQDVFFHKKECSGICPAKGQSVQLVITQSEKGPSATGVKVVAPAEEIQYHGEIKSFLYGKGYGFIGSDAFPDKDIFVLRSELPGGFGPQGGLVKFKVKTEEKGPAATDVQLLGAAGSQFQAMRMWGGKGFKGFGKGKSRGPRMDPEQKVWIGNLPEGADWKELQEHMEKAGKVKWCEVFKGKGAGTGTAGYQEVADVAKAISTLNNSTFAGQNIQVDAWVKAPKEA